MPISVIMVKRLGSNYDSQKHTVHSFFLETLELWNCFFLNASPLRRNLYVSDGYGQIAHVCVYAIRPDTDK